MRLLFALLLLVLAGTTEVDNLNLLLPELAQTSPILPLQLITAQGGCYRWASSAPDVLTVASNDTNVGCSRQAVVQIAEAGPFTSSIFVTATDLASQAILNIPVRIRRLNRILIVTKSRMMNLRQIQKLELFAYDSDENTFTSIEGLRFSWQLEQSTKIIEPVPLNSAQLYLPLRTRENLEKAGHQSDILVVRALRPGNLKITVKCLEPGYTHLTNEITLSVHERFEINPSPTLRIAPGSSFQLELVRPSLQKISLPQSYYKIVSCPGFSINETLYLTVPDRQTTCKLVVEDTRTKPAYQSTVEIIVESADQIRIIADPSIVVGIPTQFIVQLLKKNMTLHGISKDLKISSPFKISEGKTIVSNSKSLGFIKAEFKGLKEEVKINSVLPIRALLPSDYLHLPIEQNFKLKVLGGSGLYDYSVSSEIASVSSQGIIYCREIGQTIITVYDRNLPTNKIIIRLKISEIKSLRSLEQLKESNRDEWALLYMIGYDKTSQTFTQCLHSQFSLNVPASKMQIDKKADFNQAIRFLFSHSSTLVQQAIAPTSLLKGKINEIISSYQSYINAGQSSTQTLKNHFISLQNYGICQAIKFRSQIGLADRATISLTGNEEVRTSLPLRIYEPIVNTIQGDSNTFLLTPYSSLKWSYNGGSYDWPSTNTTVSLDGSLLKQGQNPLLSCPNREIPSAAHNIIVANTQTISLLFPATQMVTIQLVCKFPRKLQLSLEGGEAYEQIFVTAGLPVIGTVLPLDQNGQVFYNASNVEYIHYARTGSAEGNGKLFKYVPRGGSDRILVSAERLKEGLSFRRVEVDILITVVDPLRIQHLLGDTEKLQSRNYSITTLFTPKRPYILNILNASPLLGVTCSQAVSCQRGDNSVIVKLLRLGTGDVILRDKRLYGKSEWRFEFQIVDVEEVRVYGDRAFVQEGDSLNATINSYFGGKIISPLLYQTSQLQLLLPSGLRALEQDGNRFILRAQQSGDYQIHAQQGFPSQISTKTPFLLQVYPKLAPNIKGASIRKQNNILVIEGEVAVVIGCKRILRFEGGTKQMTITYESQKQLSVVELTSRNYALSGVVEGSYSATFTAFHNSVVLAKIAIKAVVSKIQAVELHGIDKPVIGAQFRLIPSFRVGQSEVEQCSCDFEYRWTIGNGLLELGQSTTLGFLSAAGINVTAINSGNEVVSLSVIEKNTLKPIGQASKYIHVLKQIAPVLATVIEGPYNIPSTIILPPLSSYTFPRGISIDNSDSLLKVGVEGNKLETSKRIGSTFVTLNTPGYKSQLLGVQVVPVSGVFIGNPDSFLMISPDSTVSLPFYLLDNHGRLFPSPLNMDLIVQSSNSEYLQANIASDGTSLQLKGLKVGTCMLRVAIAGTGVQDVLAVSVGSQISPGTEIKVLKNGNVRYSLLSGEQAIWSSSNPEIATINSKTGQLKALKFGRSRINCGDLSAWVQVVDVSKVEQVSSTFGDKGLTNIYKFFLKSKDGYEQISNLHSDPIVNHNYRPFCEVSHANLFEVSSEIVKIDNSQRLICQIKTINPLSNGKLPSEITVSIRSPQNRELRSIVYPMKTIFTLSESQRNILIAPSKPTYVLDISTDIPIDVKIINGKTSWVRSSFDASGKQQKISIDMSGQAQQIDWILQLSAGQQRQRATVSFGKSNDRSFWSLSMDWPDYMVLGMILIFSAACFAQYMKEQKIKFS